LFVADLEVCIGAGVNEQTDGLATLIQAFVHRPAG